MPLCTICVFALYTIAVSTLICLLARTATEYPRLRGDSGTGTLFWGKGRRSVGAARMNNSDSRNFKNTERLHRPMTECGWSLSCLLPNCTRATTLPFYGILLVPVPGNWAMAEDFSWVGAPANAPSESRSSGEKPCALGYLNHHPAPS